MVRNLPLRAAVPLLPLNSRALAPHHDRTGATGRVGEHKGRDCEEIPSRAVDFTHEPVRTDIGAQMFNRSGAELRRTAEPR